MSQSGYTNATPYLRGSWNWGAPGDMMTDPDGDMVYEYTMAFTGTSYEYIFAVDTNSSGGYDINESNDPTQSCTNGNTQYTNRVLTVPSADSTLGVVCLGSCSPCAPSGSTCAHTFTMIDSFGDGWNGATVDVNVNGSPVLTAVSPATGALAPGEDLSFSASTGDNIELANWVSGAWDGEISWEIKDGGGNVIVSGIYGEVTAGSGSCPSCSPVSAITVANLTSSGFDVSWTAGGTETEWYFEVDGSGSSVTSTSQTITGLTANSSVAINVAAVCAPGDTSSIGGIIVLTPADAPNGVTCNSATPGVAFSDDFEAALNWTGDVGTAGNGIWKIDPNGGTPSPGTGADAAHSGVAYMYYEASTGGSDTATLISPAIDLSAAADAAELSFWMHVTGVAVGDLDLGVSTSPTGPFTSVFTWSGSYQTGTADAWMPVGVDLSSYLGQTIYLGYTYMRDLTVTPNWSADFAIDLVEVNSCFNCLAPSGLTASNITSTSADVSWTAGGTETEWMLNIDGVSSIETSTTVSLTGLSGNTTYSMSVMAICGVGDSSVASPGSSFTTLCNTDIAPTNENFDAGFSNCWSQDTSDVFDWSVGTGGTPSGGTGPSDDFTGGGNYMFIETSLPRVYGDDAIMYSSVIDISGLTNPELRFLSHMYGTAIGSLSVDMWDMTTGSPTNSVNVFTKSGDQGNVWNEELLLLVGAPSTVIFQVTAIVDSTAAGQSWTGDIAMDEFGVREAAANDLALVAAAVPSGCDLTATEPIELWVVNQGLVAESAFDLSYAVNGGTPLVESITSTLSPGDTLMYVFNATADMTADGIYAVDFECVLATDNDTADNFYSTAAENYETPMAPITMGDTICNGDSTIVTADEYSYWYDAATGGNLIGEGDELDVSPTATTSYYAEAVALAGHSEDFDSYNSGDFIAASDPSNWATWSGTSADDMPISDVQGNGGNSLRVFNSDGSDVVLEFGEAFSTGKFYYAMDMYMVGDGYINFQEQVAIGAAWNMSVTFIGGVIDIDIDGTSAFQGTYSGTDPMGNPVWNTFEFECDYDNGGLWEVFVNGNSQGTFVNPDPVASVNIYPGAGVEYYLDNLEWAALKDDACTSATRTEAVVTVEDCSNINELSRVVMELYPNPSNGEFVVTASENMISINITDVQGKVVYAMNDINVNKLNVDQAGLEKGMYMINVETTNGTITKSLIVQ
jgi:hypothetical protein